MDGVDGHPGRVRRHRRSDHRASRDRRCRRTRATKTKCSPAPTRPRCCCVPTTAARPSRPSATACRPGPSTRSRSSPGPTTRSGCRCGTAAPTAPPTDGDTFERSGNGLKTNHQATDVGVADYRHLAIATGGNDDDEDQDEGATVMFLGGFDGLFRSDDDGANWRELQTQSEYLTGLDVSPDYADDGTVAVMAYVKGAYMSEDGGETFDFSSDGLGQRARRRERIRTGPAVAQRRLLAGLCARRNDLLRGLAHIPQIDRSRPFVAADPGVTAAAPTHRCGNSSSRSRPATRRTARSSSASRQGDIYKSTERGDEGTWEKISNVPVADPHRRGRRASRSTRSSVSGRCSSIREYPEHRELYVSTGKGVFHSLDDGTSLDTDRADRGRDALDVAGVRHGRHRVRRHRTRPLRDARRRRHAGRSSTARPSPQRATSRRSRSHPTDRCS